MRSSEARILATADDGREGFGFPFSLRDDERIEIGTRPIVRISVLHDGHPIRTDDLEVSIQSAEPFDPGLKEVSIERRGDILLVSSRLRGSYEVALRHPEKGSASTFVYAGFGEQEAQVVLPNGDGTIRGIVVDALGAPVPDAEIRGGRVPVINRGRLPPPVVATSGTAGEFALHGVRRGKWELYATALGYADSSTNRKLAAGDFARFELQRAATVEVAVAVDPAAVASEPPPGLSSESLMVRRTEQGDVAGRVAIRAVRGSQSVNELLSFACLASPIERRPLVVNERGEGLLRFEAPLSPGTYVVVAYVVGIVSTPQVVTVSSGETRRVEFALPEPDGARIVGRVRVPNWNAFEGGTVELQLRDAVGSGAARAWVDRRGRFEFSSVPPGERKRLRCDLQRAKSWCFFAQSIRRDHPRGP